jgi:hypothetical protein
MKKTAFYIFCLGVCFVLLVYSCKSKQVETKALVNPEFNYLRYKPASNDRIISRKDYYDRLQGFWLGQCIANWTGLVTEMDRIGNIGDIKTGEFYTRNDWKGPTNQAYGVRVFPVIFHPQSILFLLTRIVFGELMTIQTLSICTNTCSTKIKPAF